MPFTPKSESRISKAVRRVERMRVNPPLRRGREGHRDTKLRRFELIENLAFGSNATAYLLQWTGAAYVAQSDVEFEVYDVFSKFNQWCKPTGQDGARGYAQWMWDRGIWEIIQLEHQARWIKFAVTAAFDTSDASEGIDTISYCDGYEPDTEPTTVYNVRADAADTYIFEGADNARGLARFCPGGGKYYIENMECP